MELPRMMDEMTTMMIQWCQFDENEIDSLEHTQDYIHEIHAIS